MTGWIGLQAQQGTWGLWTAGPRLQPGTGSAQLEYAFGQFRLQDKSQALLCTGAVHRMKQKMLAGWGGLHHADSQPGDSEIIPLFPGHSYPSALSSGHCTQGTYPHCTPAETLHLPMAADPLKLTSDLFSSMCTPVGHLLMSLGPLSTAMK